MFDSGRPLDRSVVTACLLLVVVGVFILANAGFESVWQILGIPIGAALIVAGIGAFTWYWRNQ